ncbi:hypothetical protein HDZ31DRAFT_41394 [Schizophyllum fasciatum]
MLTSANSFSLSSRCSLAVGLHSGLKHSLAVLANNRAARQDEHAGECDPGSRAPADFSLCSSTAAAPVNPILDDASNGASVRVIESIPAACLSAGLAARRRRRAAYSLTIPGSQDDKVAICPWEDGTTPCSPVATAPSLRRHAGSASSPASSFMSLCAESTDSSAPCSSFVATPSSSPTALSSLPIPKDFTLSLISLLSRPKHCPPSPLSISVDVNVITAIDYALQDQTF